MANSQIVHANILSPPVRRKEQRPLQAASQGAGGQEEPSLTQQFLGSAGSTLAKGFGEGLAESFGGKIKNALEASAVKKALGNINQKGSPLDQYLQIAQMPLDPSVKNELLKNYLPMVADQRKAELQQQEQSILGRNLAEMAQTNQQRQPYAEVNRQSNRLPETTNLTPDEFAKLSLPSQKSLVEQSNKNKKFNAQQQQHEEKQAFKEKQLALSETQKYRDDLLSAQEGAKMSAAILERMDNLVDKGQLSTPLFIKTLNTLGLPIGVLTNSDTQEFDKLSYERLKGITKYYGNKILKSEVDAFLRTIPTTMNSDEGKKRIIHDLQLLDMPAKLQFEAYKAVVQEEGGIPLDLREKVLIKMEPVMDKWAAEFKAGLPDAAQRQAEQAPPPNTTRLMRNGIEYNIPNDKVQSAMQSGFTQQQAPQQQMQQQQQMMPQQQMQPPPQAPMQMTPPPQMAAPTPPPAQAQNNLFQPQSPIGGITQ